MSLTLSLNQKTLHLHSLGEVITLGMLLLILNLLQHTTNYRIKKKETSLNILVLLFLKNIFTSRVLRVITLENDRKELLKFK